AWYEFYPASPVYAPSSDVVKPGDTMYANVTYVSSSGCFVTVLKDITEGLELQIAVHHGFGCGKK
ncbi:hypothetical protein B9Q01_08765, partial [Candidatus Marsarchaeota G1 archaeon OSP_D]